ncbi:hypothetical protein Taro_055564, partial [Colocasia esculenta]|nr:hypothetical protein [Colocasia esculenta]
LSQYGSTVEVCVVFLDTLTPVFELYVRLRGKTTEDNGLCLWVCGRLVSSVGRICQPNCTAGSLFGIAAESRGGSVRRKGGVDVASPAISNGFWLRMARAAREPCEDDARSVGVPSMRRLWGVLRHLLPWRRVGPTQLGRVAKAYRDSSLNSVWYGRRNSSGGACVGPISGSVAEL